MLDKDHVKVNRGCLKHCISSFPHCVFVKIVDLPNESKSVFLVEDVEDGRIYSEDISDLFPNGCISAAYTLFTVEQDFVVKRVMIARLE